MSWDIFLFRAVYGLSHKFWLLDWAMVFLAQYSGYFLVVFAIVFFFLLRRDWKMQMSYFGVVLLSILLSSGLVTALIRYFYYRPRPYSALSLVPLFEKSSGSFPSGHAAFFFALALAVLFFHRKMGIWFLVVVALMGFARVFAGVHYPLDVLGGAIIGILSAFFAVYVLEPKKFRERFRKMQF